MIKNVSDDVVVNVAAFVVALLALLILAVTHGLAPKGDLASVDAIATTIAGGCIGFVSRGSMRPSAPPPAPPAS